MHSYQHQYAVHAYITTWILFLSCYFVPCSFSEHNRKSLVSNTSALGSDFTYLFHKCKQGSPWSAFVIGTSKKTGVCVAMCVYLAIYPLWTLRCRCNFGSFTLFWSSGYTACSFSFQKFPFSSCKKDNNFNKKYWSPVKSGMRWTQEFTDKYFTVF